MINQENKVVEFSSLFSEVEVKKKQKDLYKYAPKSWTCYEVVEVFSDGSVRHTGITFCTGSGAGDSGGDSGDYGYVGGGGTKTTTENDDKIINELEGKADCTFQKLKNNSILAETLKEFIGEETPVHLILTQESDLRNSSGQLLNGRTDYGDSYYITITLNTEQAINRPSLDVARTILHEAIHAEIYKKIKSTTTDISKIIVDKDSWPSLFDYYNKYPTNPHHNYMADYYRAAIEKGLREYAKSIGQTYPDQLYEDLAWVGLRGTEAWDNMYADPIYTKNEQERILNSVIKFSNSGKNECV